MEQTHRLSPHRASRLSIEPSTGRCGIRATLRPDRRWRGALALALALTIAIVAARPGIVAGRTPDGGRDQPPGTAPTVRRAPAEVELIGGYRYDRSRDQKCAGCLNDNWEWYGDRVRRWAEDCLRGGQPACATREAAERDSVERLYSEFMAAKRDWAASGFLDTPAMAGSRHNCPDYWAGRASGCVAAGSGTGSGSGSGNGGGINLNPFAALSPEAIFKAAFETITRLFARSMATGLGELLRALGGSQATVADLSLPPALTYDSRAVRGLHDLARALAWGFLLLGAIAAGFRVMGARRREVEGSGAREELERLAFCAIAASCCWWPLTLAIRCANALTGAFTAATPLLAEGTDQAGETTLRLLLTIAYLVASLGLVVALYLRCARLMLLLIVAPLVAVCEVIPGASWIARLWGRHFAQVLLAGVIQTIALRAGAAVTEEAIKLGGDAGLARLILGVVLVWFTFGAPALLTNRADRHESQLFGLVTGLALRSATRGLVGGGGGSRRAAAGRAAGGGGGAGPAGGPAPPGGGSPRGGMGGAPAGERSPRAGSGPSAGAGAAPRSSGQAAGGGPISAERDRVGGESGEPDGAPRPPVGGWPRGGATTSLGAYDGASSRAAAYRLERDAASPGSAEHDRASRALREAERERDRAWAGIAAGEGAAGSAGAPAPTGDGER